MLEQNSPPRKIIHIELRLNKKNYMQRVKKCFIKIRNFEFESRTAEVTSVKFQREIFVQLFEKLNNNDSSPIRLLGVGVGLYEHGGQKIELPFEEQPS